MTQTHQSDWKLGSCIIDEFEKVGFTLLNLTLVEKFKLKIKLTVRMPMVRPELATPGLQTQCSSHLAIQLKSYCWLLLTIGIVTVKFSTGTRSSCVQWNHCTSRMRSQSQLRNDKYIMMQYTVWTNSTPSQQ